MFSMRVAAMTRPMASSIQTVEITGEELMQEHLFCKLEGTPGDAFTTGDCRDRQQQVQNVLGCGDGLPWRLRYRYSHSFTYIFVVFIDPIYSLPP